MRGRSLRATSLSWSLFDLAFGGAHKNEALTRRYRRSRTTHFSLLRNLDASDGLLTLLSPSISLRATAGLGRLPTKSPIVCLGSDSRHWGLKNYAKIFSR